MTPEQKALVQNSFQGVAPIADTAAELFYGRLFALDPDLRGLFGTDLRTQGRHLMSTLAVAVRGLDDLGKLVPVVQNLGRRHVGYGVREAHYATVGEALIWTLRQGLGSAFTPDMQAAWAAAYAFLATTMQAAAAEHAQLDTAA